MSAIQKLALFACTAGLCLNTACSKDDDGPKTPGDGKGEGVIRLVTYNVATFRYDAENFPAPDRAYTAIGDFLKEIEADVVCVNEIDDGVPRTDGIDQPKHFAEVMGGWDYIFGPALDPHPTGGRYGEAAFSRKKAIAKDYVFLPQGVGTERRVMCVLEFDDFVFLATHLEHSNGAAHPGQIAVINDYVDKHYANSAKPIFLAGDMNARPESETMALYQQKWKVISSTQQTFPANKPDRCLDYILAYKNDAKYQVVQSQVVRLSGSVKLNLVSDHLPVFADIKLQ